MVIYDSVKKKKVLFKPIKKNEVSIYICGPTVYDDAHLGHARSALVFDLLRRVLKNLGFNVVFVKNFTDIDDKIINKIKESKKSLKELTTHYISRYKNDMRQLYIQEADIEPKATESIDEIINFIQTLIDKNCAYQTKNGVYFDTSKDDKYLTISHRYIDESNMQSRLEEDVNKKNSKDFALWKVSDDTEISYPSPFGNGRPGWHIECSAMINKYLANKDGDFQIDIHAGGSDLLFPHHENEAAQTRKCTNQEIAKYWMHNGFVTIDGEKMSKSLGNSFFLKDILKIYHGEIIRFYLLSTHYRSNIDFNDKDLLTCKKRLDKFYRLKKRLNNILPSSQPNSSFKDNILQALSDDLNISVALSHVDEMINHANIYLDKNKKDEVYMQEISANINFIQSIIGIGNLNHVFYFQLGIDNKLKEDIKNLIQQRMQAKQNKDYKKADAIRDMLLLKNIQLMDTPNGTEWERIEE